MTDSSRQKDYRALVTGGAGFLGSHLCERLLDEEIHVVCLDNFITGSRNNISPLRAETNFQLMNYDITQSADVSGEFDLVFHFASPASPVDYMRLPIETLKAGSIGTMHALEIARRNGARFILASTSEVYGNPLQHPQRESYWGNVNPIGPRSVYDEAKRFSEALAAAYRQTYKTNTAIARIFNTYGPRMRPEDGRAIPTFIHQALRNEPITVAGDGSQTRSVCYVDDTVDCILKLAHSEHPGPINIGSQDERTILDVADFVCKVSGSHSVINFVGRPIDDPEIRKPDLSLAGEVLGWKPSTSLQEGIEKTISWFAGDLVT